jgi:hypothetical protein
MCPKEMDIGFTSRYFGFAASKNTNAWLQEEHYSFVSENYGLM